MQHGWPRRHATRRSRSGIQLQAHACQLSRVTANRSSQWLGRTIQRGLLQGQTTRRSRSGIQLQAYASTLEIGQSSTHLHFHSSHSDLLHTNVGTFDVRTMAAATAHYLSPPRIIGYGVSSDCTWITYQGKNRLWLPPEYRPTASAVYAAVISIGCSSGRIFFLVFSESLVSV